MRRLFVDLSPLDTATLCRPFLTIHICPHTKTTEVLSRFTDDADVVVFTEDGRSVALHRVILCGRSDYFKTMLASSFREGTAAGSGANGQQPAAADGGDDGEDAGREQEQERAPLPSIHLDISWAALSNVVHWLYSDELLPPAAGAGGPSEGDDEPPPALAVAVAVEVLDAATRFMLPGLRNLCCTALVEQSDAVDVFSLHELASLYELPRCGVCDASSLLPPLSVSVHPNRHTHICNKTHERPSPLLHHPHLHSPGSRITSRSASRESWPTSSTVPNSTRSWPPRLPPSRHGRRPTVSPS